MAGDWIKMRNDLADDPAVIDIAARVGLDEFAVVGRLHTLWAWADEQSRDGHARGVTSAWLDRKVQRDGFADALVSVGWLELSADGLSIVNFDHHNGETAKTRALGTRRKQRQRAGNGHAPDAPTVPALVPPLSLVGHAPAVTKARPEKRREEIKRNPPNPRRKRGSGARFEDFWLAWPKNERKQDKAKCFDHWKLHDLDAQADAILVDVRMKRGTTKWAEGHIEAPLTYLRGKRWLDGQTPNETTTGGVVAWDRDGGTIVAKGIELGIGAWNRDAFEHGEPDAETFHAYTRRVAAAVDQLEVATG